MTAAERLAQLILDGDLLPIDVFGGESSCRKCNAPVQWSFGLMDRFSEHSPAGSDCNRAGEFMVRPSDELMQSTEVIAAIKHVIDIGEEAFK